jgi:6-phosphofructo-2-kinase / fructose-2,6-biphosphatase 4
MRRRLLGDPKGLPSDYFAVTPGQTRSAETEKLRASVKKGIEDEIYNFFFGEPNGQVAIYDANNGTVKQRDEIRAMWVPLGVHMFFIG